MKSIFIKKKNILKQYILKLKALTNELHMFDLDKQVSGFFFIRNKIIKNALENSQKNSKIPNQILI